MNNNQSVEKEVEMYEQQHFISPEKIKLAVKALY